MMKAEDTNADDPEMVALDALIWLLHDERRAARLLDVTGLTPDGLRAGVGDHATLAAVMTFLEGHEPDRSEEHTSELQSLMRISYAVFCLKKKKQKQHQNT